MSCIGVLLLFLGAPLLIGFFVGEKKNIMWRNLGLLLAIVGLLIIITGAVVGF